jgi:hypothetical protein
VRAHVLDQRLDVGGARRAVIDDEIGVLLRDRRVADAKSLQARALDEPRRVIARRIGEYRAAAPLADGLRCRGAFRGARAHGALVHARLALELELRGEEPFIGGTDTRR